MHQVYVRGNGTLVSCGETSICQKKGNFYSTIVTQSMSGERGQKSAVMT